MALALRLPLFIAIVVVGTSLPRLQPVALAAGLDAKGKAVLKQATRFYKQGMYDEAAKLLTDLVVDHPEMSSLQRNLGACYYYLRRPEPALSNLRDYLAESRNKISAEDRQEVERWIDEMEKLHAENAAAAKGRPAAEPSPPGQQAAAVVAATVAASGSIPTTGPQPAWAAVPPASAGVSPEPPSAIHPTPAPASAAPLRPVSQSAPTPVWQPVGLGDCPGNDVAATSGPAPYASRCHAALVGQTAVCWTGGCTYKNVLTASCKAGANPGQMYTCEIPLRRD
jgi:hypothetical protein